MRKFFGKWRKENCRHKKYEAWESSNGITLHLISIGEPIKENDCMDICNIIISHLEQEREEYGEVIAEAIYNHLKTRISAVSVDGGPNGIDWLVQLSINAWEFVS